MSGISPDFIDSNEHELDCAVYTEPISLDKLIYKLLLIKFIYLWQHKFYVDLLKW